MNIYRNLTRKCKKLVRELNGKGYCYNTNLAIVLENDFELLMELALYCATKSNKRFIYLLTNRDIHLPLPVDDVKGIGYDYSVAFTSDTDLVFGDDVVCIVDYKAGYTKEQIDNIHSSKILIFESIGELDGYRKQELCNSCNEFIFKPSR